MSQGELILQWRPEPLGQNVRNLLATFPGISVTERREKWWTSKEIVVVGPASLLQILKLQIDALESDFVSRDAW